MASGPLRSDLPEWGRKRGADYQVDDATGCWVWQKSLVTGGYGRIQKNDGLWMARIKREGVRRVLGFFKTETEAATAIKEAGGYGA